MKALLIFCLILAAAMTPRAKASDVKPSLEVQVLGSGGPRAFGRAGSSYIVLVDGTPRILLDAGPGAFVRIGELNIDLQQVDIVLLTHLHIDHSGDLAAFFNARALTSDGPIKYRVFGPDALGCSPKPRDSSICWLEIMDCSRTRKRLARGKPLRFAIWQST